MSCPIIFAGRWLVRFVTTKMIYFPDRLLFSMKVSLVFGYCRFEQTIN